MNETIKLRDIAETAQSSIENRSQPGTWEEALLSGLPHLFIATLLLVVTFIPYIIELFLSILIILGAIIFIFGVITLLRAARLESVLTDDRKTIALFTFAALGLPLMFLLPMFDSRKYAPTSMPFGLFYENKVPELLVYAIGVLCLFMGGWLVDFPVKSCRTIG